MKLSGNTIFITGGGSGKGELRDTGLLAGKLPTEAAAKPPPGSDGGTA